MEKITRLVNREELDAWTNLELAQALIDKEGSGFENAEVDILAEADRSDLIKECMWAEINQ